MVVMKVIVSLVFLLLSQLSTTADAQVACSTASCINGSCVASTGLCACNQGWVGAKCSIVDPCLSGPCGGKGSCFPIVTIANGIETASFKCQCYLGFAGDQCQTQTANPCNPSPCLNSGQCSLAPNGVEFSCNCAGPYTGPTCGTYIDRCANNKCKNGAKCTSTTELNPKTGGFYFCDCLNTFSGAFCETEKNECESNPCKNNAACYDLIDAFYCACVGSYTGTFCETYVDPCSSNPCGANSQCTSNESSYTCACRPGFFGDINNCQPNPCSSNPCKKADSSCIPILPNGQVIIGPCTCTTQSQPSYTCVCNNNGAGFVSADC